MHVTRNPYRAIPVASSRSAYRRERDDAIAMDSYSNKINLREFIIASMLVNKWLVKE